MNNQVTPLLTSLSNIAIEKFQIDTKNDIIKLNFNKDENQKVSEIIFKDVTSFYYMDNDSVLDNEESINQKNKSNEDKSICLNNIMYCNNTGNDFVNIASSHDDDSSISIPNFVLELSDSSVFIEANSITIDKKKFIV